MVISGTTLALLALLAATGTTAVSTFSDSAKRDRETLTDSELEDVLTYMSEHSQPLPDSELSSWDKVRLSRKRSRVSDDVNAKQDSIRRTGFEDILNNPYWKSLSKPEQKSLLREYLIGDYTGSLENIDFDSLRNDLDEYYSLEESGLYAPELHQYVNVDQSLADAQAAIDDENKMLLKSLNEDLRSTSNAYTQSRDSILTQQHQLNASTVDSIASEMSRSRRNAIEAGASAGIRIAENVNTLLSAQNQISQRSLETSNQLAQMLVSQRNAEAGLRNQWRDTQLSTYDRVQSRAANERSLGQARYDEALSKYNSDLDRVTSATNPLVDRMQRYRTSNSSSKY